MTSVISPYLKTSLFRITMETYNSDIERLLTDTNIINYFTSNNKSLFTFINMYIEVDKVLKSNQTQSNVLYNRLDEIKTILHNQNNQINTLSNNISNSNTNMISVVQSKLDSIKDITNNELAKMFVDLQKHFSKESNVDDLKRTFDTFRDRIELLNNQKLNDIDRKNLEIITNIQSTFERSLDSHQIHNKITSIETTLSSINENFSNNSAKKGQVAETVLLNILTETFPDTEVTDTSNTANAGDIQLLRENRPTILIDSKNFGSKPVPKRDLDKFYNDIQQNNCSGILCNAFGGIANKQHFEIDIVDKNIIVFIHSHQFDAHVFKLATNIIYNMHEELKDKQTDCIMLDQRLYQNIKIEYNYYIQTFRHHLDIIKSNVNALSQLSFTLLDNFFKRKATNVQLKRYSCPICSTQVSTEKILKIHIKKMHSDLLPPPSTDPVTDPATDAHVNSTEPPSIKPRNRTKRNDNTDCQSTPEPAE